MIEASGGKEVSGGLGYVTGKFKDLYATKVHPLIAQDLVELAALRPTKVEQGAVGGHFSGKSGHGLMGQLKEHGEKRNITVNMLWAERWGEYTPTGSSVTFERVRKFVRQHFSKQAPAEAAGPKAGCQKITLDAIPEKVPATWALNVAIFEGTDHIPDESLPGGLSTFGPDVARYATELALAIANEAKDAEAARRIKALIVNWPADFKVYKDKEAIHNAALKYCQGVETATEYFGLHGAGVLQVIRRALDRLQEKSPGGKVPTTEELEAYLTEIWPAGVVRVPRQRLIDDMLRFEEMMQKAPGVRDVIDLAKMHFGRKTSFDDTSKLTLLMQKAGSGVDLTYVFECVFVHMLRNDSGEGVTQADLKNKVGPIQVAKFARGYMESMWRKYPNLSGKQGPFVPADGLSGDIGKLRTMMLSPLKWYNFWCVEGVDKSWAAALPSDAQKRWLRVVCELNSGVWDTQIRTVLTHGGDSGTAFERFNMHEKVKNKFFEDFSAAYANTTGEKAQSTEPPSALKPGGKGDPEAGPPSRADSAPAASGLVEEVTHAEALAELRKDLEAHVRERFESRCVCIHRKGAHNELAASLANKKMFQSLNDGESCFIAFYDVKNAKMSRTWPRQSWWQNCPPLDLQDFKIFIETVDKFLKPGIDSVWILAGKSETSTEKIRREIRKLVWKFKLVTLCYDVRMMEKIMWNDPRGFANGSAVEPLFCCWKGPQPRGMPLVRFYVDPGSSTYVNFIARVPVCKNDEHLWVSPEVKEKLTASMTPSVEEAEQPKASRPAEAAEGSMEDPASEGTAVKKQDEIQARRKRTYAERFAGRSLYRPASTPDVPAFPHDNSPRLVREVHYEAGGEAVKWIFHGSPAGGAGMSMLWGTGVGLVFYLEDDFHEEIFMKSIIEKAVEDLIHGGTAFADSDLYQRAKEVFAKVEDKKGKKDKDKEKDKD